VKNLLESEAGRTRPAPRTHAARSLDVEAFAQPDFAELVIESPLAFVAQHVVGKSHPLEALFSLGIIGIAVRVQLARELSVRLLDFLFAGALLQPQVCVQIAIRHRPRPNLSVGHS